MTKAKKEVEKAEEVKAPKAKAETYTIVASYKVKNEADGTVERVKHEGKGDTAEKALAAIEDYPNGLNCNILVTVTHGNLTVEKSIAPHNARAIMEHGDMYIFERQFRGV